MKNETYSNAAFSGILSVEMAIKPLSNEADIVRPTVVITTENLTIKCPITAFKSHDAVDSIEVRLHKLEEGQYGRNTVSLGEGVYLKHDGIYPTAVFFGPEVIFEDGEPLAFGIMGYLGCPAETILRHQMIDGGQRVHLEELKDKNEWSNNSGVTINNYDNN